jgi:copper transport protein
MKAFKAKSILTAAAAAFLGLFLTLAPASAHADVVRTEPADNSAVPVAPAEIKIWFSEAVTGAFSTARVINDHGQQMPVKGSHVDSSDPTLMVVEPPALPDGVYTVSWQAVSTDDGHVTRGSFVFRVGASSGGAPLTRSANATPLGQDPGNPPVSIPEAVLRWLGYFGLLMLVGAAFMPQLVLRQPAEVAAASRTFGETGEGELGAFFRRAARRIYLLGALAAGFTFGVGLLYLAWQVYSLAGNGLSGSAGAVLGQVLLTTAWGYAWLARQVFTAALGLVFLRLGRAGLALPGFGAPLARDADAPLTREDAARTRGARRWQWLAWALVGAVLAAQSAASHAASGRSPGLPLLADWLHLLFAGLWIGGLLALAAGILPLLRRGGLDFKQVVRSTWGRFGLLAAVSVGMLAATGLYSAGQRVISADALLLTGYGQALIVKVGLMLAAGLVGLANTLSLHPRLSAPLGRWLKKPPGWTPFGLRRLPQRVLAEASLGVAVALLAGILTSLPPASEPQYAVSPSSQPDQMVANANDLYIGLAIRPNRPGQNVLNILVTGTRPAEAPQVTVRLTYLEQALGTLSLDATQSNPNSFHLSGDALNQPGRWRIEVVVHRSGLPDAVASFNWTVLPLGTIPPVVVSRSPWKEALSLLAGLMAGLVALALGLTQRSWRSTLAKIEIQNR